MGTSSRPVRSGASRSPQSYRTCGSQPPRPARSLLGVCAAEGARVQTPIQSRWLRCTRKLRFLPLLGFTTAAVPRLASGLSRRLGHARPLPRRLLAPELGWLGLILLFALALRILILIAIEPTPLAGDEADYYQRAVRLASQGRMEGAGERAPANEFFFAALFRLFGISPLVARLGNVVLSTASAIPIYALGRQLGGGANGPRGGADRRALPELRRV